MRIPNSTKKRRGAGIVEYGLIVGLIAVGAVVAVQNSGDRVSGLLNTVATELSGVQNDVTGTSGSEASGPEVGAAVESGMIYAGKLPSGSQVYVATLSEQQWGYEESDRKTWTDADSSCSSLIAHNTPEWKLPTIAEMEILIDSFQDGDITTFASSWYYWTSEYAWESPGGFDQYHLVTSWSGGTSYSKANNDHNVRCVHVVE